MSESWQVIGADVVDWSSSYDGEKFHAILCDPPYHLTTGKKGGTGEKSVNLAHPAGRARITVGGTGFMGTAWDGGDIAFQPEVWVGLAEHLYSGAFIFAFAGARTYHRLAIALEDAGLRLHPCLGWLTGQGFPKSVRVGERYKDEEGKLRLREDDRFTGHRYGGGCIKPALELIAVTQKPYGRPVECITETGAGVYNIDGARVGVSKDVPASPSRTAGVSLAGSANGSLRKETGEESGHNPNVGRWPPNFALCHLPECEYEEEAWNCAPDCPVAALNEQAGVRQSGKADVLKRNTDKFRQVYQRFEGQQAEGATYGDKGHVSRFFPQAHWLYERMELPILYQPKASRKEREQGLSDLPTETFNRVNPGGLENEPRWAPTQVKNTHPTVKPIALAKWMATLLLPPDEYAPRRLLVPFAGSGSEMVGALLAGWDEIVGIELVEKHCEIARARLQYWASQPYQAEMPL